MVRLCRILSPICLRSLVTIGCGMKKFQYFENVIITTSPYEYNKKNIRIAIGYPFPGRESDEFSDIIRISRVAT